MHKELGPIAAEPERQHQVLTSREFLSQQILIEMRPESEGGVHSIRITNSLSVPITLVEI